MTPHIHTDSCQSRPEPCSRVEDIDPRTTTGLYRLTKVARARKKEGKSLRTEDKSLMWWFGYHAIKALWPPAAFIAAYWVAKKLGVQVPTL
jgi:hypothetical protein